VAATTPATSVTSKAQNNFWQSLEKNLKDILRESDKILPEGSSETVIERSDQQATTGTGAQGAQSAGGLPRPALPAVPIAASLQQQGTTVVKRTTFREAASIIVNPEAGVVVVRATSRQHEKVQEYLDMVLTSARRQVIIEATIAEVSLKRRYQQGINWQSLRSLRPGPPTAGFSDGAEPTGVATVPDPFGQPPFRAPCLSCSTTLRPGLGIVLDPQPAGNLRQGQSPVQPENQRAEQPDGHAQGRGQRGLFQLIKNDSTDQRAPPTTLPPDRRNRCRSAWS
jgi:hypothetical protein